MNNPSDRLLRTLELERRAAEAADRAERVALRMTGGGGTSGGMTDDWKIAVDRQLVQLHGDVRNLLYGLIGGCVLLAGMVGGLYLRNDAKFEAIDLRMQARAEKTDERLGKIEATLARIDAKLDIRGAAPKVQ